MTLGKLSKKAGMPSATVSQALHGKQNPTLRTIGKIARGLGVGVTEIIEQEA